MINDEREIMTRTEEIAIIMETMIRHEILEAYEIVGGVLFARTCDDGAGATSIEYNISEV
jgi:hypothetical protein